LDSGAAGKTLKVVTKDLAVITDGLATTDGLEVRATVSEGRLLRECEELVRFVAHRAAQGALKISDGQEPGYGYWRTQFIADEEGFLEMWELDPKGEELLRGVNLTLRYWIDQHETCRRFHSEFVPPRPDQLVVVSEGVFEGDNVKVVRYSSPEHMSGWWMVTDRYNGKIDSLRTEHLVHLTFVRPDLSKYIALSEGFRFDLTTQEDVWFDEAVLREEA